MSELLLPLAFLACPIGMGLMMFFMMKGMRRGEHGSMASAKGEGSPQERLARLEEEKRALEQQLASPEERLMRLQAEKQALEHQLSGQGNGRAVKTTAPSPNGKKLSAK